MKGAQIMSFLVALNNLIELLVLLAKLVLMVLFAAGICMIFPAIKQINSERE
jgi:hypothetical protein